MYIDLTVKVTRTFLDEAFTTEITLPFGHLGTHFDVMNKEFPLSFLQRDGIVFDVSKIEGREIDIHDIDISLVDADMFIAFHSGYIARCDYGSKQYFQEHPQLSVHLLHKLIEKGISIIGIDFAGVRRGKEHTPMDQYCADRGVFIVENLCNLNQILDGRENNTFIANTYPLNFEGMTGLPCRVVAQLQKK